MSKPILYWADLSPPTRFVLMTAKEIGLEFELRPISLMDGDHMKPEFLKMNPMHTIPTMDDNGAIIWDSHAISTYLVEKYAKNDKLYPKDLLKRSQVDQRLHFDSGFLFARLRFLFEPILYHQSSDVPQYKCEYLEKTYKLLEDVFEDNKYLVGSSLTLADLACIATISSCVFFAPISEEKYPKLTAWVKLMNELPYYKDTNQKGVDEFDELLIGLIAKNKIKTRVQDLDQKLNLCLNK